MKNTPAKSELQLLREELLRPEIRCFGRGIELYHDFRDEHVDADEMPLFAKIRRDLSELIRQVEQKIREQEEGRVFRPSVISEPQILFEDVDYRDSPEEWRFVVHRSVWESFEYRFDFQGVTLQMFQAGD